MMAVLLPNTSQGGPVSRSVVPTVINLLSAERVEELPVHIQPLGRVIVEAVDHHEQHGYVASHRHPISGEKMETELRTFAAPLTGGELAAVIDRYSLHRVWGSRRSGNMVAAKAAWTSIAPGAPESEMHGAFRDLTTSLVWNHPVEYLHHQVLSVLILFPAAALLNEESGVLRALTLTALASLLPIGYMARRRRHSWSGVCRHIMGNETILLLGVVAVGFFLCTMAQIAPIESIARRYVGVAVLFSTSWLAVLVFLQWTYVLRGDAGRLGGRRASEEADTDRLVPIGYPDRSLVDGRGGLKPNLMED